MPNVENRVAELRARRGLSASALAAQVGISRQTVYAIENGSYVPNTQVALHLARTLAVSVDDLFRLSDQQAPDADPAKSAHLLPGTEPLRAGQQVQLCEVHGRLFAASPPAGACFLPVSDAIMSKSSKGKNPARVHLSDSKAEFGSRVLLAGCDPAMALLARSLEDSGITTVLAHRNSSQALALLKAGCVHVAGTHLRDRTGDFNLGAIRKGFPSDSVAVFSFAIWQEGLVIARGNPKHIEGVESLARPDVVLMNRESGAGSRKLLDASLQKLMLNPKSIRGYDRTAPSHLTAAAEVKKGNVDCCMATEATARALGLDFLPLASSRYDLAVATKDLNLPGIQALLNAIHQLRFRKTLQTFAGYDTSVTGNRIL